MSESGSSKGMSLWLMLLLVGAVVLVALLYLRSVVWSKGEARTPQAAAQSEAKATTNEADARRSEQAARPTQAGAHEGGRDGPDEEAAFLEGPSGGAETEVIAEPARPALQTPHAAPLAGEGARPEPEAPPAAEAASSERPVAQVPLEAPADRPAETAPEEPAAMADPSIAEEKSQREHEAVEAGAAQAPPSDARAASGGLAASSPPSAPPPAQEPVTAIPPQPVGETLEERRARILSEYEAMRKRAEEEMRRRWGRGGSPLPYGYPGYPPGYYPPGRQ